MRVVEEEKQWKLENSSHFDDGDSRENVFIECSEFELQMFLGSAFIMVKGESGGDLNVVLLDLNYWRSNGLQN